MKTTFSALFSLLISLPGLAQIITNSSQNYTITFTPQGIFGQMNNNPTISSTNTALGDRALIAASTITNNTAIGAQTIIVGGLNIPNAYNGNNNTAVGSYALRQNVEGYNNSVLGFLSMDGILGNNSGNSNAVFGHTALSYNQTGNNNAAFGRSALYNNVFGNHNAAFGAYAAAVNQTGNNLAAFGNSSLQFHKSGDGNTGFGGNALYSDQTGTNNVAFGALSLQGNISGNSNTALGASTLYSTKTGSANTALGQDALSTNDGQSNTAAGFSALDGNTTGANNTAFGNYALHSNVTGSGNIAIGAYAGHFETGSDKLYIDASDVPFDAGIVLIGGNFSGTRKVCIGCTMSTTGENEFSTRSEAFQVQGAAFKTIGSGSWQFPSDRRLKREIVSLDRDAVLEKVLQMRGVSYDLIAHPEQGKQYGFIAQELREIFPTKVYENNAGFLSSSYGDFVPMFVEALKALNQRIEKLEQNRPDIKTMTARVEEMETLFKDN